MSTNRLDFRIWLEHRKAIRFPGLAEANCYVSSTAEDPTSPGWVFNLSKNGIAVLLVEHLPIHAVIDIQLENEHHHFARRLKAEVKHSDICFPNDSWLHGCVFLEPLSEDDLGVLAKNKAVP